MIVTANEYLDARKPEWLDAELLGHVSYDKPTKTIHVTPTVETVPMIFGLRALEVKL